MEKDLFDPVKKYFEAFGYVCDGEVNDIDLYMQKGDKSVAVELKQTLDFKAVKQAALRQKVTDVVFIGIFRPSDMNSSAFKDSIYILKRLGIGLITVSKRTKLVEIVNEPEVTELSVYQTRNKSNRSGLEEEFKRRKVKNTTGGVHRTKLMTGYREETLIVLKALNDLTEAGPAKLAECTGVTKAGNILRDNYYGWFENVRRGIYRVTECGKNALEEYKDVLNLLDSKNGTK